MPFCTSSGACVGPSRFFLTIILFPLFFTLQLSLKRDSTVKGALSITITHLRKWEVTLAEPFREDIVIHLAVIIARLPRALKD